MQETANSGPTTHPTGTRKTDELPGTLSADGTIQPLGPGAVAGDAAAVAGRDLPQPVRNFFHSIHGTLNHLLVADQLWFGRFTGNPVAGLRLDNEVCAGHHILADQLIRHAQCWTSFVDTIDVPAYDSILSYLDSRGHTRKVPFSPTLSHVFNHGTHHRGQILAAMTGFGLPAPELDLIYYLVKPA